jgi:hypothetical protein
MSMQALRRSIENSATRLPFSVSSKWSSMSPYANRMSIAFVRCAY